MAPADRFDLAPKVELHVHLEGAIPLDTLWELVTQHGGDPDVSDRAAFDDWFVYRDFAHFIETWWWMTGYLQTEASFTRIAEAVGRSLADQNIIYAEASFSPTDFERHRLTPEQLAVAIRRGLDHVPGIRVNLTADLVRDTGPDRAMRTLEAVLDVREEAGIAGITIGGSEHDYPPEPFAAVYRRAADAGLRLTAHAGEAAGPASIWGALRSLNVARIGHGIRAVEDAALVHHLVEHQIPLEVCPTSNLRTGVATSWVDHPVHELLRAGANVTINTDDPTFFDCSLAGEFRALSELDGPTADIERLTYNAIGASWLDAASKAELRGQVATFWRKAD